MLLQRHNLPPSILNNINRRLAKRLRDRPQIPQRKARETWHPGRWRRRDVSLPQPVGLDCCTLALPCERMRVERVSGIGHSVDISANTGGKGRRRRNRRPLREDRLRIQCAYGRDHLHRECAPDQEVPLKPAGPAPWFQRGVAGAGVYDVELYVPDERTGVLEPLGTSGPGKLTGRPCPARCQLILEFHSRWDVKTNSHAEPS